MLRVARYSARVPVAESRLRYDADHADVQLVSDRSDGPCAGVHRMTALESWRAGWIAGAIRGAGALRGGVRDAAHGSSYPS